MPGWVRPAVLPVAKGAPEDLCWHCACKRAEPIPPPGNGQGNRASPFWVFWQKRAGFSFFLFVFSSLFSPSFLNLCLLMIPGWRYSPVPRPGHMGGSPSSNCEPYPACPLPSTFHIPFLVIWYILPRVFSYTYKEEHEKVNQCHSVSVGDFLKDSILYFLMFETIYISSQNGTFLLLKIWKKKTTPTM